MTEARLTWNSRTWTRGIAATTKVDKKAIEKLPLAGIRVLDMTRVLAGVGVFHIWCEIVRKY